MTEPKSSFACSYNDVTAQNLDFYYLRLLEKIKHASFVALDFEFTGLCKAKTADMNHRYVALKEAIESHTIVSMGISVIQRKTKKSDLVRSTKTDLPLSQPQPHSDSPPQSQLYSLSQPQPSLDTVSPDTPSVSDNTEEEESQSYLTYECDNFDFLALTDTDFSITEDTGRFLIDHGFSFDRLFQQGIRFTTPLEQSRQTAKDNRSLLAENKQKERFKLSNMWKTITSMMKYNNIPLVVHNGLYDIMYLYHSFMGVLPNTLRGFENAISERFPSGIYDTKHLVSQYGSEFTASFLTYLFNKCDRLRQNSFTECEPSQPYFEVTINQPILPPTDNKSKVPEMESKGIKRKQHTEPDGHVSKRKITICKAYAERGYCSKEKQGDPLHHSKSPLHDIQLVLDHEMGVSAYKQNYTSNPDDDISGAHSAYYDAYMTAFVFCYLKLKIPLTHLHDNINKINLDSSIHPLRLPVPKK
ncbi:ribonuclease H-like domain-containing protein [Choanephora cucurbitarum]|nr:ribonuclease H-like domain-containing protein [Choanephora cucurbitarum]